MTKEAALVLALTLFLASFLPIWTRLVPYRLCITWSNVFGWSCHVERIERQDD